MKNKLFYKIRWIIGFSTLFILIFLIAHSFLWLPHPIDKIDLSQRLTGPSWKYWLGTDHLGRDLYSRVVQGTRNTLLLSATPLWIGAFIGILIGLLAATWKNWFDKITMSLMRIIFAFPIIVTAILITATFGTGYNYSTFAICLFNIPIFAYFTRNIALKIWVNDYVIFSLAIGNNNFNINKMHILPKLYGPLMVQLTIQWIFSILAEAGLSYLGLGIQPPNPSLGSMLYEFQSYLYLSSRLIFIPGIIIFIIILGLGMLGDCLRDFIDPEFR